MRRAVFSDSQRKGLEKRFQMQKYISKPDRKKLAERLGLKDSQVRFNYIIFQYLLNNKAIQAVPHVKGYIIYKINILSVFTFLGILDYNRLYAYTVYIVCVMTLYILIYSV